MTDVCTKKRECESVDLGYRGEGRCTVGGVDRGRLGGVEKVRKRHRGKGGRRQDRE